MQAITNNPFGDAAVEPETFFAIVSPNVTLHPSVRIEERRQELKRRWPRGLFALSKARTVAASSAQAGERRRAQTDGSRPGEDTEHREGRIELEPARGKIQPAGSAVMVVLEQLAEGEEVQR